MVEPADILVQAGKGLGIDDRGFPEVQVQFPDRALDLLLVPEENRVRDAFVDHHLAGPEDLGVPAFQEDDALGVALGFVDDPAHDFLGMPQASFQVVAVTFPVLDGFSRNPGLDRGARNGDGCSPKWSVFQSTFHRGERPRRRVGFPSLSEFQSTLPRGERPKLSYTPIRLELFQSTLPREERLMTSVILIGWNSFQIHAPA